MTPLSTALLWLGVAAVALASLAVVVFPGVYGKLHGMTPATSVGAVFIGVAIALHEGPGHAGGTVAFVTVTMLVTAPVMATATARAAELRSRDTDIRSEAGDGKRS